MKKNRTEISLKDIIDNKLKRRRELSRLPIAEKIKVIVRLQEALYPVLIIRQPRHLKPWKM